MESSVRKTEAVSIGAAGISNVEEKGSTPALCEGEVETEEAEEEAEEAEEDEEAAGAAA
jgi:hypothetical protein